MKKNTIRVACIYIIFGSFAFSQSNNASANRKTDESIKADKDWEAFLIVAAPPSGAKIRVSVERDTPDAAQKIGQQAEHSGQVSLAARSFYTRYPSHPKATEARKIEAISSLRGIKPDKTTEARAALSTAAAFRDDKSLPANDRSEVALEIERYQLSQRFRSKAVKDTPAERLKIADGIKKEFGDTLALQSYYLTVARRSDPATANSIASGVATSSVASSGQRAEASAIVARCGLIGKPLALKLQKLEGGEKEVGQQTGEITALVVWSPSDSGSLSDLRSAKPLIGPNMQVVYLALGGDREQVKAAQGLMPTAGTFCHAASPATSRAISETLRLKYAPAPTVYVWRRDGKLAGFGRLGDLPTLLAQADR